MTAVLFVGVCLALFVVGVVLAARDDRKSRTVATPADWLLLAEAVGVVREGTPIFDVLLMEMSARDFMQWEREVTA